MSLRKAYQMKIIDGVFQAKLNPDHPLLILAAQVPWETLADELAPLFKKIGRNAKPVRLMVGAQLLKHMHNLSDEDVVERLKGDVYWLAFCGVSDPFKGADWTPLDPSTMTNFRKRLGPSGTARIEKVIRDRLLFEKRVNQKSQYVDTTAMPKNVAYPTDTDLLDKGRRRLLDSLRQLKSLGRNVVVGRTFTRLAKKALVEVNKLGKDRQERIEKGARKLIAFGKTVLRNVKHAIESRGRKRHDERQQAKIEKLLQSLKEDSALLERVIEQTEARYRGEHVSKKVYSLHEPAVTCIAKGKRSRPNEYGSKISISVDNNGYVVHHEEFDYNVGDSKTLESAVTGWKSATGQIPDEVAADRGYHDNHCEGITGQVKHLAIPTTGKRKHVDSDKHYFKRLQRKRASIEPVLSHLKQDHRMDRCRYKGFTGDQINVSWAVSAWNSKKWLRELVTERRSQAA